MTTTRNPISKSFVVGRPINATVSIGDVVTLNITLTDDRGSAINLTGCTIQVYTMDTEPTLWSATITDQVNGKFYFTFQPDEAGQVEAYVMVVNTVGEDEFTTTFYLGSLSVADTDEEPETHITSLTTLLNNAATAANTAATAANAAAASIVGLIDDTTTASNKLWSSNKVSTELTAKEASTNKVISLSSSSTDTQYPSAKCVYDIIGDVETLINDL